jgi:hypothetical protein
MEIFTLWTETRDIIVTGRELLVVQVGYKASLFLSVCVGFRLLCVPHWQALSGVILCYNSFVAFTDVITAAAAKSYRIFLYRVSVRIHRKLGAVHAC